jgi:uncharacterized tellurite resistance protein B-like protein
MPFRPSFITLSVHPIRPHARTRSILRWSAFTPVVDAALAVAGADGRVANAEVSAIVETLRRMFGRAATPGTEAAVRARRVPETIPYERLDATLSPAQRQLLLMQLTEIAAADAVVTPHERAMLHAFASRLAVPEVFVMAVVDASLARADVAISEKDALVCPSCAAETPAAGAYCTSCGSRMPGTGGAGPVDFASARA